MMLADTSIYYGVALAGLVSFGSPCVLPLVPPYLIYLGATSLEPMACDPGLTPGVWRRTVSASVFFVLGFTAVFVALGAGASAFGQLIGTCEAELAIASGWVIMLFGTYFIAGFKILQHDRKVRRHAPAQATSLIGAMIIGASFALSWTPCVGPILATVLAIAARDDTLAAGITLLLAYALGLGLPFILCAIAIGPAPGVMTCSRRHLDTVQKGLGCLLVITGLLFLTGQVNAMGNWILDTFPGLDALEATVTPKSLRADILTWSGGR